MIVVSADAHIKRPKIKLDGFDDVVKVDQFVQRIRNAESDFLAVTRIIASDTLEAFATRIAALHRPIAFDWRARFGLDDGVCAARPGDSAAARPAANGETPAQEKAEKLTCAACGEKVSFSVARFCWFNKARFGGAIYCIDCQKGVEAARK